MVRFFARRWAKRRYIWNTEIEAATHDLNASLSALRAKEKRAYVAQLRAEADAIDENIKSMDAKLENGFWECENGHEIITSCGCALPGHAAVVHISDCIFNDFNAESCPRPGCKKPMKLIKRDQMSGHEQYESDKQRGEAEKIAEGGEQAAKHFTRQAAASRATADRIRNL